jgi:hypothetical protein
MNLPKWLKRKPQEPTAVTVTIARGALSAEAKKRVVKSAFKTLDPEQLYKREPGVWD